MKGLQINMLKVKSVKNLSDIEGLKNMFKNLQNKSEIHKIGYNQKKMDSFAGSFRHYYPRPTPQSSKYFIREKLLS